MNTNMHTEKIIVTPAQAEAWLKLNDRNPRRNALDKKRAHAYATAIVNGQWLLTHQGIAFDEDGFLIDGQHRLYAIAISGIAVEVNVTFGVPVDSVGEIDRGIRRNMQCVLGIDDKRGSEVVSFFSRMVFGTYQTTVNASSLINLVLPAAIAITDKCGTSRRGVSSTPVRAGFAFCYLASNHDESILEMYRELVLLDVRDADRLILIPEAIRALFHRLDKSERRITNDQAFAYSVVSGSNPNLRRIHTKEPSLVISEVKKWIAGRI